MDLSRTPAPGGRPEGKLVVPEDTTLDDVLLVAPDARMTETEKQMRALSDDGKLPSVRARLNVGQLELWEECAVFHQKWSTARHPSNVYKSGFNKVAQRDLRTIRDRVEFFEYYHDRFEKSWNPAASLSRLNLLRKMCWSALNVLLRDLKGLPLSRAIPWTEEKQIELKIAAGEIVESRKGRQKTKEREYLSKNVRKRQAAQKFPNMALTYLAVETKIASLSAQWSSKMLEKRSEALAVEAAAKREVVGGHDEAEILRLRGTG